jgi:hypothetical protein
MTRCVRVGKVLSGVGSLEFEAVENRFSGFLLAL